MAFRIGNMAAKFLLALYTARYLRSCRSRHLRSDRRRHDPDAGACWASAPATGWSARSCTMSRADALAAMTTRLCVPSRHACGCTAAYCWLVNLALGSPVPWPLVWASGLILFLEHRSPNDASDHADRARRAHCSRASCCSCAPGSGHSRPSSWGMLDPAARTLELSADRAGSADWCLLWIVLAGQHHRASALALHASCAGAGCSGGVPGQRSVYIKDLAAAAKPASRTASSSRSFSVLS